MDQVIDQVIDQINRMAWKLKFWSLPIGPGMSDREVSHRGREKDWRNRHEAKSCWRPVRARRFGD